MQEVRGSIPRGSTNQFRRLGKGCPNRTADKSAQKSARRAPRTFCKHSRSAGSPGLDAARLAEAAAMEFEELHMLVCMRRDATHDEVNALAKALSIEPAALLIA
jgi:hypothetical protein